MRNFQAKNEIAFNSLAVVQFADSTDQIKQAQRRLRDIGFYTGSVDGILGPNTAAALRRYQAKHGLPETGDLDTATQKALEVY
jgi:peptidoglycan hydrolase-like protein with peptidoglycan-binding domain